MSTPMPGPSRRPAPRPSRDQVLAAGVVPRLLLDEGTRDEQITVEV
ncbi:hypothetical protein ACTMTJ_20025 [Phytohabitans sp. LJ34]